MFFTFAHSVVGSAGNTEHYAAKQTPTVVGLGEFCGKAGEG